MAIFFIMCEEEENLWKIAATKKLYKDSFLKDFIANENCKFIPGLTNDKQSLWGFYGQIYYKPTDTWAESLLNPKEELEYLKEMIIKKL